MFSKFLRPIGKIGSAAILGRRVDPETLGIRRMYYVPPNQYDVPIPNKLRIGWVMRVYWETIPLFVTTFISLSVLAGAILWACFHKVDIVFTTHNRENISRTMDLRNPSVNKMIVINQRYEPWPEMQDVLDKMRMAEKRALARAQSCSHS